MNDPSSDNTQVRRYLVVFGFMLLATLMTAGASYIPFGARSTNIIVALSIAAFQAFLVLGYMMHLISERRMIYGILAFTALFLVFLMGLTIWAHGDLPGGHRS